ncbi:MAG: BamA/TamA family outer membrane protein [Bacteroidales bacterium]|nr:BamA/TamA family outer membrane protein [Bacteroidales bacterium]
MKHLNQIISTFLVTFFVIAHATTFGQRTFYSEQVENWQNEKPQGSPVYTIYLIGDVKYPAQDSTVIQLLHRYIAQSDSQSSVVFPGDIVYPKGLPEMTHPLYENAKSDLDAILSVLKDYKGSIVFMPGNHDWERGRINGWDRVVNEEFYIETTLNRGDVYLPGSGCPGPSEVHLTTDIVLIVLDTQWLLHENEKPGPQSGCGFEDENGIFVQVEDALRRNKDKKIIFVAHHPLFSAGNHGGYFPASRLLFPMLDFNKYLYVPLPGFIYTWYRKYLGHIQDIAHPKYKEFKYKLLALFKDYPELIYVAGHEHNLQYVEKDSLFHIISGGGGEGLYIAKKKKAADFAMQSRGFSILKFYENGDVWTDFIVPDGSEKGKLVFRKKMFNKEPFDPEEKEEKLEEIDYTDSTVTKVLNSMYDRGKFVRFLMGDNYRAIWDHEVTVPVFDIGTKKGGLKIIKRGGGQQTRSVRLEDKNGKQYVLRSVNKYVEKALDEELQNTVAEDVVQDVISASHPYAALTVPKMADAIGVFHTNPEILWVPDDPRLGIYRKDLANNFYLFEERPDDDRSDVASFGRSKKIRSTSKMLEKLRDEQDHRVDQMAVLKARIFDMLLGDWDRHDDQWRWASFKPDEIRMYEPIPRDRDQVFFVNEGVVMWMVRRNFILPKFQGFDYNIDNVKGLGYNARYFDRSFLTEPDLDDWKSMSEYISAELTDSIIHQAILDMPPEAYKLSGAGIEDKLRVRRDNLWEYMEDYYYYLSKTVDVVGTDDRELFEVERKENGNTEVTVTALSKKKGKEKFQMYHREFKPDETKEIRLYGLKDEDTFVLKGEAKKGIKIRIIGGTGQDTVIDESKVGGLCRKTLIYDRKGTDNYFVKGPETKMKLSREYEVNQYDRKGFQYNKTFPLFAGGYNVDDGIYAGGGAKIFRYNFRDSTIQKIKAQVAFETGAFGFTYQGLFSSFSKRYDLLIDADLSMPRNVDNFFGYGNETEKTTDDVTYYRVRYRYIFANPKAVRTVNDKFNYAAGVFYQYFKIDDTSSRFIANLELNNLDSVVYRDHNYGGINVVTEVDTRDSEIIPKRGLYWKTELRGFVALDEEAENFAKIQSDIQFYLSFRSDPRVILVLRFGGASNFGNYEFYHSNFLGRRNNLRGFRNNRFAGDQSVYQNTEIRYKLMNLENYFFKGQAGFLVHNDIGRVWIDGEKSERWHDGYGFGVWISPFNYLAASMSYSLSNEDQLFDFRFNFTF